MLRDSTLLGSTLLGSTLLGSTLLGSTLRDSMLLGLPLFLSQSEFDLLQSQGAFFFCL